MKKYKNLSWKTLLILCYINIYYDLSHKYVNVWNLQYRINAHTKHSLKKKIKVHVKKNRLGFFFTFKSGHIFKTLALTFVALALTYLICCHTEE